MSLRAGDWVRVRSEDEILATLDGRACLDGLPFMPQMVRYCGRRFRVSQRAHKLCDTANETGARRMPNAVLLDGIRCDGSDYGGCQMECLILWKESWLVKVDGEISAESSGPGVSDGRLLRLAMAGARRAGGQHEALPVYACQATELPRATTWLSVWSPGQYVDDWVSGNATLREIAGALLLMMYDAIATAGIGLGTPMRMAYEWVRRLHDGGSYPARPGKLHRGGKTPSVSLGLAAGDTVRVKDHARILTTVTEDLVNRGMAFHPDMVRYCTRTFQVRRRVSRIINEKTGELMELRNPCIVLDGVQCSGSLTKPLLCPRGMFPYWREIWLDRVDGAPRPKED